MNFTEFKDIFDGSTIYLYMSTEGVVIWSSSDPVIPEGQCTLVLHTEIDNTSGQREIPKSGDRLDNYQVNRETGSWNTSPSHWVVWRVESFESRSEDQVISSIVIAWCKKEVAS